MDEAKIRRRLAELETGLRKSLQSIEELRSLLLSDALQDAVNIATEAAQGICHKCKEPLNGDDSVRGCHRKCHKAMMRLIEIGETTERELVELGNIAVSRPPGRKRINVVQGTRSGKPSSRQK